MSISTTDLNTLRTLAGKYAAIANLDVQRERLDRYYRTNALEIVRPVLLISEVPWGEIKDDALKNVCARELGWLEGRLRRTIYQAEHFPVDAAIGPIFKVNKQARSTGVGLRVQEEQIKGDTGTNISSHTYTDLLQTEEDLAKLQIPEITYAKEATLTNLEIAADVFSGLMEVKLSGSYLSYNIWDIVSQYRGVQAILMDLIMRPDFMHQTAQKFADIAESDFRQTEELGLLDSDLSDIHCTVVCSNELPSKDFDGKARRKDVWGRCAAQIFGDVSPAMHDEFDLAYNQKLFGECGLVYYGCCEPMDSKIDILRKRFDNLRKVSITPWADPQNAAKNMGGDLVMAAKPNPAAVAMPTINAKALEEEIAGYCRACKEYNTPLEFVLKDISTISNNPNHLTEWAAIATRTIDKFYG
jgi:hypothetical protein